MLNLDRKKDLLLREMKCWRESPLDVASPDPLGRLTAIDIRLPLKPEFMAKIGTVHGTS